MKKDRFFLIFIIVFILFILLNILLVLPNISSRKNSFNTATNAIENECSYCTNEPPCCAKMIQNSDMHECEWPIRGYCTLGTCNSVDVEKKERCGWYWVWHDANDNEYHLGTNGNEGYGCMIGASESSMQPRCTASGPITLGPSITPTPSQTSQPTPSPTPIIIKPTAAPVIPTPTPTLPETGGSKTILRVPTNMIPTHTLINTFPTSAQNTKQSDFEFPSIQLPALKFSKAHINLIQINSTVQKPMNIFNYLFNRIIFYDKKMETTINNQINILIERF